MENLKDRVLSSQLKDHIGQEVLISGWLHKERKLGGMTFLIVRDRHGLIQVLDEKSTEAEKLKGLQVGTVLTITGTVVAEPRAAGGAEIHDPTITINVPVEAVPPIEIDKPLSHKSDNLDTLFEHRVVGVRNIQEGNIFRIRSGLEQYIRGFLVKNDFVEMNTPKILAGATEGGAEVFKVDYFGKEAVLAQSPQFYKQIMVGAFERVFEIGPAYRAEPSATTRHVSEVTMLDIEMGFIKDHEEVLDMVQDMTHYALTQTYEQFKDELKGWNAPELVLTKKFPRYTVAQVHEMYSKDTGNDTTKEKDLIPDEERWIYEYAKKNEGSEAVFVTHFPVAAMKFYHKINPEDPSTVMWADLLFRGVEIATCPQRENIYEKLLDQMKKAGLDPEHPGYKYYLEAFKYGLPDHGGCGYGIDRLLQKIIGLNNVKEAILFPRDINRLAP